MSNTVTLITGASGGIGEALAHVAAKAGRRLILVARSEQGLNVVAESIQAAGYSRPDIFTFDLGEAGAADQLAKTLLKRNLTVAELVNNAGYGLLGPVSALDRSGQIGIIDLNVRALTDLTLRFLPEIIAARGGILNVASTAAYVPGPGMAVYYASKAYVLSFSEALSHECKGRVRVTALCPVPTPTGFQERANPGEGNLFPLLPKMNVTRVAEEGWRGFEKGKRVVIPGLFNKITAFFGPRSPRALVLAISGRLTSRRSKNAA